MVDARRGVAFLSVAAILAACLALPDSPAEAGTLRVPSDQPTIQDAIDVATDGVPDEGARPRHARTDPDTDE